MIKIFFEDKKSFMDKYGEELSDLFFANRSRLPSEVADISIWEKEYKKNPKIARKRLKAYLDEFSSNTEITQFKNKFGSALYTRFNAVKSRLPAKQQQYRYWFDSAKEQLWDVIDEYLPSSYWEKVQKGAEFIKETADWEIYKITNYEASEYYGRGTGWCTAGNYPGNENNGLTFFNRYAKEYYFYFNKNTGALYNRFRKNPGQPGADIQIWIGITNDGRTVDNNVSDNKEIKEQLPRVKALDGEEKKPVSSLGSAQVATQRPETPAAPQQQTDIRALTQFAAYTTGVRGRGTVVGVHEEIDEPGSFHVAVRLDNGRLVFYDALYSWIPAELADRELGDNRRFPEEFFTDEEILEINSYLGSFLEGSDNTIIQKFRSENGLGILDQGVNIAELQNIIENMTGDATSFQSDNVDRVVNWIGEAYGDYDDFYVVKVFVDGRWDSINTCCNVADSPNNYRIVETYPGQNNNEQSIRDEAGSDNENVAEDGNVPVQDRFDMELARRVITRPSLETVECIKIDEGGLDGSLPVYQLTRTSGEVLIATLYEFEDIREDIETHCRASAEFLVNVAYEGFSQDDILEWLDTYEVEVQDHSERTIKRTLLNFIMSDVSKFDSLCETVFNTIDRETITETFAESPLTDALRCHPAYVSFCIDDEWYCLVG